MTVYIVAKDIPWEGWEEPCFATTDKKQAKYVAKELKKLDRLRGRAFHESYEIFELPLCGELT